MVCVFKRLQPTVVCKNVVHTRLETMAITLTTIVAGLSAVVAGPWLELATES